MSVLFRVIIFVRCCGGRSVRPPRQRYRRAKMLIVSRFQVLLSSVMRIPPSHDLIIAKVSQVRSFSFYRSVLSSFWCPAAVVFLVNVVGNISLFLVLVRCPSTLLSFFSSFVLVPVFCSHNMTIYYIDHARFSFGKASHTRSSLPERSNCVGGLHQWRIREQAKRLIEAFFL
jgi:hypothetical protein